MPLARSVFAPSMTSTRSGSRLSPDIASLARTVSRSVLSGIALAPLRPVVVLRGLFGLAIPAWVHKSTSGSQDSVGGDQRISGAVSARATTLPSEPAAPSPVSRGLLVLPMSEDWGNPCRLPLPLPDAWTGLGSEEPALVWFAACPAYSGFLRIWLSGAGALQKSQMTSPSPRITTGISVQTSNVFVRFGI